MSFQQRSQKKRQHLRNFFSGAHKNIYLFCWDDIFYSKHVTDVPFSAQTSIIQKHTGKRDFSVSIITYVRTYVRTTMGIVTGITNRGFRHLKRENERIQPSKAFVSRNRKNRIFLFFSSPPASFPILSKQKSKMFVDDRV